MSAHRAYLELKNAIYCSVLRVPLGHVGGTKRHVVQLRYFMMRLVCSIAGNSTTYSKKQVTNRVASSNLGLQMPNQQSFVCAIGCFLLQPPAPLPLEDSVLQRIPP